MKDLRTQLEELGYGDITLFENFSYDTAFIGISEDERAIYDYDLRVQYLVEEAVEWIDYNTLRALPYIPNHPIILNSLVEEIDYRSE